MFDAAASSPRSSQQQQQGMEHRPADGSVVQQVVLAVNCPESVVQAEASLAAGSTGGSSRRTSSQRRLESLAAAGAARPSVRFAAEL